MYANYVDENGLLTYAQLHNPVKLEDIIIPTKNTTTRMIRRQIELTSGILGKMIQKE